MERLLTPSVLFQLHEKVVLVTGASRGIGRATAEMLAEQGAHVLVHHGANAALADEVVAGIRARGGKADRVGFDVSKTEEVDAALTQVIKEHGRLDALVNNAGISIDGLLVQLKDEVLDQLLAVNLRGALACTRAALRPMMKAKKGRIVFISSVVGEMGNAGQTAYAASKAALLGATKSLAKEYAKRNITVNAITPGWVDTDMTRALPESARAMMLSGVPLGRPAAPSEIAGAVVFLCSDEASYITGAVLRVNGGMLT